MKIRVGCQTKKLMVRASKIAALYRLVLSLLSLTSHLLPGVNLRTLSSCDGQCLPRFRLRLFSSSLLLDRLRLSSFGRQQYLSLYFGYVLPISFSRTNLCKGHFLSFFPPSVLYCLRALHQPGGLVSSSTSLFPESNHLRSSPLTLSRLRQIHTHKNHYPSLHPSVCACLSPACSLQSGRWK